MKHQLQRISINIVLLIGLIHLFASTASATSPESAQSPFIYEIESLFPMYFMDGYHIAAGVRWKDIRVRASCIDGGYYDYEPNNQRFERNLGTGCGLFLGYYLWKNLHAYVYVEAQNYIVHDRDTRASERFDVIDIGPGLGYQYFFFSNVYLQPAIHLYWRKKQEKYVAGIKYTLRNIDVSPTVRVGYRF
ncbi:MAG: hypothetical protein OEY38_12160 [Gammaproteobacteria bacterium]|nr:hypothetical protein [Gammaproteobacteria bacterium]